MNQEKAAWLAIAAIFIVMASVMFGLAWLIQPFSTPFYQIGLLFGFSFFILACLIISWAASKHWPDHAQWA